MARPIPATYGQSLALFRGKLAATELHRLPDYANQCFSASLGFRVA